MSKLQRPTLFLAPSGETKHLALFGHQVEVFYSQGCFYGLTTYRHGTYLQLSKSYDGISWFNKQTIEFPDPALMYVHVIAKGNRFLYFYTVQNGTTWHIRLGSSKELGRNIQLHGTILAPSTYDDHYCVGSCCTLAIDCGKLILWYTAANKNHRYNIQVAESHDGINWEKKGTAYQFESEDSLGCSKPSVVVFDKVFYMFFSKPNPDGRGYHGIGAAYSFDGYRFSDLPAKTWNVTAHPFGSKYPCVLKVGSGLHLWAMKEDSFPSQACHSLLAQLHLQRQQPSSFFIVQAGQKQTLVLPPQGTIIDLILDRAPIDCYVLIANLILIHFCNGQAFIKPFAKTPSVMVRRFTPCGTVQLDVRPAKECVYFHYHDMATADSLRLSLPRNAHPNQPSHIEIIRNRYGKRNGNAALAIKQHNPST